MMSILLVDLGNTRLKWATCDGTLPRHSEVRDHREQELAAVLDASWNAMPPPGQVLVASVADSERKAALSGWMQRRWSLSPEFLVSPSSGQGLTNAYAQPERLGCDRWAAMVAAFHLAGSAVCVVDCGSAVTLDAVAADGQHLGGLILPGLTAMQSALTRHTALSPIALAKPANILLGRSTQEGISLGITRAVVALIQQTLADLQQHSGIQASCYLTGGDAGRIEPLLSIPCQQEPDLVLQGLAVIAGAT
ncbi:MAG: type III pantothenate kinase [Gammaproteobacteria bacterium]